MGKHYTGRRYRHSGYRIKDEEYFWCPLVINSIIFVSTTATLPLLETHILTLTPLPPVVVNLTPLRTKGWRKEGWKLSHGGGKCMDTGT